MKPAVAKSLVVWIVTFLFITGCWKNENGPLRVSDINSRYFTDNSGKAIYLTGVTYMGIWLI